MATRSRSPTPRRIRIDRRRTRLAIVTYGQRMPHAKLVQHKDWQLDLASAIFHNDAFCQMNGYHHMTHRAVLSSPGAEEALQKGVELLVQVPRGEVLCVSCAHGFHRSVAVGCLLTDWCLRLVTNARQFDMGLCPSQRACEDLLRAAEKYSARPVDEHKLLPLGVDMNEWAGYATCKA